MKEIRITQSITNRTESLNRYLDQIGKIPILSTDEEVELAYRVQQGDEDAAQRMVNANLRFVVSVAKQYRNQGVPLDDLIMEGNLGLIRAVHSFDPTRGFKFISYAVWWIRQTILQSMAEKGRMVRLPLNRVGMLSRIRSAQTRLMHQLERMPSNDEVADYLQIPLDRVNDALMADSRCSSMDAPLAEDSDTSLAETLPAETSWTDHRLMNQSLSHDLDVMLGQLKEREREVLILSFGIGCTEQSLDEIGMHMQLTRERVRQIREHALTRLRSNPKSAALRGYLG